MLKILSLDKTQIALADGIKCAMDIYFKNKSN